MISDEHRRRFCYGLALLLLACDSEGGAACIWDTEELLAEVDAHADSRLDCGSFGDGEDVSGALACFHSTPEGEAAEFTVNNCIDCSIRSTYVVTPTREMYHLFREADVFGDKKREVTVEACDDVVASDGIWVECVNARSLYSCEDEELHGWQGQ